MESEELRPPGRRWPGEDGALPSKPQGNVQPPQDVLLLASEEVVSVRTSSYI